MNNPKLTKNSIKRVTIIGSLNPAPCYEEWEQYMLCKFSNENVSELIITSSNNILNNYVKRFCDAHDFNVHVAELDSSISKEEANNQRNTELFEDTDFVMLFVPDKSDNKKVERSQAKPTDKEVLVVFNNIVFNTIHTDIGNHQFTQNTMTTESIKEEELITPEEELALIARAQKGDTEAMTQLIGINRRFVTALARKYEGKGLSLDELISEGNKGIEAACMKFDPTRGFKFISFAVWFVRQSIQNALNIQK